MEQRTPTAIFSVVRARGCPCKNRATTRARGDRRGTSSARHKKVLRAGKLRTTRARARGAAGEFLGPERTKRAGSASKNPPAYSPSSWKKHPRTELVVHASFARAPEKREGRPACCPRCAPRL